MYIRCMRISLASLSWLDQKVNKKIDAYGYDADDSGIPMATG